jgi:hypothetical protein
MNALALEVPSDRPRDLNNAFLNSRATNENFELFLAYRDGHVRWRSVSA